MRTSRDIVAMLNGIDDDDARDAVLGLPEFDSGTTAMLDPLGIEDLYAMTDRLVVGHDLHRWVVLGHVDDYLKGDA